MGRFDLVFKHLKPAWFALVVMMMAGCFSEMRAEVECSNDRDCFFNDGEYCSELGRCSRDLVEDDDVGEDIEEPAEILVTARIPDASVPKATDVCPGLFDSGDILRIDHGDLFTVGLDGPPPAMVRFSRPGYQTQEIEITEWEVSGLVIELESCDDVECTDNPPPC